MIRIKPDVRYGGIRYTIRPVAPTLQTTAFSVGDLYVFAMNHEYQRPDKAEASSFVSGCPSPFAAARMRSMRVSTAADHAYVSALILSEIVYASGHSKE